MGKQVDRPPLPTLKDEEQTIGIVVTERPKPELVAVTTEPIPRITIPEQLSHPVALRTEKLLASGKEDRTNRILPKKGVCLHVLVSRDQMSRALRILNALLLLVEERGCTLSWPGEEDSTLSLMIDGEALQFGICEIFHAKPHVLTAAEKKYPYTAPRWDYQLTGRLRLFVGKLPYASKGRSSWSDARHQRLENCLESFVVSSKIAAAATKKERLEREEEKRRWEEEQKREEEERMLAIEQNRRAEVITELMRDWNQSRSLRTFAKAIAKAAQRLELSDQEKNDIQQVVDWTCDYAGILDPISNLPDSVEGFVETRRLLRIIAAPVVELGRAGLAMAGGCSRNGLLALRRRRRR